MNPDIDFYVGPLVQLVYLLVTMAAFDAREQRAME